MFFVDVAVCWIIRTSFCFRPEQDRFWHYESGLYCKSLTTLAGYQAGSGTWLKCFPRLARYSPGVRPENRRKS